MFNREILYEQELPNVSNKAPYYLIFFFFPLQMSLGML